MKKHFFAVIFSLFLMSFLCITAHAANFKDVSNGFWANKEIAWAYNRGLMNGTSKTTFDPNGKTLRGQMTAILYRYAGSPEVEQAPVYSDVPSTKYYADASVWAVENAIMEETRLVSKTMDAEEPISRAEFCAMLLMFSIYSDTYVAPSTSTPFIDTGDLSDSTQWAIEWAYCHGIVNGTSASTFNPHSNLTRAAAAAILYRYEAHINTNPQLSAEVKAKELVEYYACPYPRMIEDLLSSEYGYDWAIAERAVEAAIGKETWKPYAISLAESFFKEAPKEPTKEELRNYLQTTLGFPPEVADYAVKMADIPWGSRSSYSTCDWISLTELSKFGFSAKAAWGAITLKYLATNVEYILTGLPGTMSTGSSFPLDFSGEIVSSMYYRSIDDLSSPSNSCFFLDKNSLISAGILAKNDVSDAVKTGLPQEYISASNKLEGYTPAGSSSSSGGTSSSSGGTSVTVPTHSETTGTLVWVPTNGGTKYHSRSGCSSMIAPIQVSIETAKANGYTACGRCH